MIKKVAIILLLTLGIISLIVPVSVVFDKNKKIDNTNTILGGLVIGFSSLSIAGYLLWDDKRKREQEKFDSLRKLFFEVIESSGGKINSLQFAQKVTLSGKTNLSGHEATFFLDQMVKEFGGHRDVNQKGTIYYEFDLEVIDLLDDGNLFDDGNLPPKDEEVEEVEKEWQNSNDGQLIDEEKSSDYTVPETKVFNALDAQLLEYLEDHLCVAEWQKADEITAKLMLKVANQTMSLNPDDIADFPCEALRKIDELWQIDSHNHFGFLAQTEVFNDCFSTNSNIILTPKNWQKYAQSLGWYANAQWPNHHGDLRFSLTAAPKGYLPFLPVWQGAWWGTFLDGQGERFHLLIRAC
ncbi:MAG: GUN4 domain-containing protein [Snowella sp.]|nr:GUN4 domain-containing protein [Snowella sp.]